MHTILEHFRSALCNLKKGGIDLSLNKWVELVSLRTTDFSLTGIFLLFPFSPLHARVLYNNVYPSYCFRAQFPYT